MYRSTGDIFDDFEHIKRLPNSQKENLCCSAPGSFNDIDMLVAGMRGVGNVGGDEHTGCTDGEYRYHFAMWCLFSSPLMIGCDIRNLSEKDKEKLRKAMLKSSETVKIDLTDLAEKKKQMIFEITKGDLDEETIDQLCKIINDKKGEGK